MTGSLAVGPQFSQLLHPRTHIHEINEFNGSVLRSVPYVAPSLGGYV